MGGNGGEHPHFNPLGAAEGSLDAAGRPAERATCVPLLAHTLGCPRGKAARHGGLLGAHGVVLLVVPQFPPLLWGLSL